MEQDTITDVVAPHVLHAVSKLELGVKSLGVNCEINQILMKTVLKGGKRLRPLLTYLMGDLFKVDLEILAPYARAIELVHAASLAHDDVLDSAVTRRGIPSINVIASNKKAILAGDYLLAEVINELTRLGNFNLVSEMSLVIKDLAEGEWLQVRGVEQEQITSEHINLVAKKKTASVLSWCCIAPAYIAKVPSDILEYARLFGLHLGLAFQMVDDILDFDIDSAKGAYVDLKNGIINSVSCELIKEGKELTSGLIHASELLESIDALVANGVLERAKDIVRQRAGKQVDLARSFLTKISTELADGGDKVKQAYQSLDFLLDYLIVRKF